MSKSDDKARPVHEKLARIEGSTSFRDLREGFGGFANITQEDVMAALAMVRTHRTNVPPFGPEILSTYFGSSQTWRRMIVEGYLECNRVNPKYIVAHRLAATLAAQVMAGVSFTAAADAEYAFIANIRVENLIALRKHALHWFDGVLEKAMPAFSEILREFVIDRLNKRADKLLEASARHDAAVEKLKASQEAEARALALANT